MTFPTPTGAPPLTTQLTSPAWQNQPTTEQTFNETVNIVTQKEGIKVGGYFRTWYTNVWKKDKNITPNQAVAVFLTGYSIATATGKLASFLTGSTYQVSSGGTNLGGGSEGPGVAQAAAKAAESLPHITNPLDWLKYISDFFSRLTQANTWIRIGEFVLGAGLVIVGVAHMAKGTPVGQAAARTAKRVGMAAAL